MQLCVVIVERNGWYGEDIPNTLWWSTISTWWRQVAMPRPRTSLVNGDISLGFMAKGQSVWLNCFHCNQTGCQYTQHVRIWAQLTQRSHVGLLNIIVINVKCAWMHELSDRCKTGRRIIQNGKGLGFSNGRGGRRRGWSLAEYRRV